MTFIAPYKRFNKLIQNETFEPMLSWGIRMAISAMVPLIWGLTTNNVSRAIWITLTAECLCWVELKGSFVWQVRTLFTGALLAIIFSVLGSVTGGSVWLSVLFMFGVSFLATLLKNVGDRASGLAICVYLLFIFCNGYPVAEYMAIKERVYLILAGAGWAIFVSMATSLFTPEQQPFRRQIALIWRAVATLANAVGKGWDGSDTRSNIRDIYLKEKDVRTALDNSFQFYTAMAYEANKKEHNQYQLTQLRKATSLVATHIVAISEEIEGMKIKDIDNALRLKISALFGAFSDLMQRMAMYVITLKPEDELLVNSNIRRLKKLISLVKQYPYSSDVAPKGISRIILLSERATRLMENAISTVNAMNKDETVIQAYSFAKTLVILNPRSVIKNLGMLLNFSTFNIRYALRSAIATALAIFVYKWFKIDHGYWLPFSVLIVIQPYFGATFKKAIDRVVGTLLGGIAGSLFIYFVPKGLYLKEALLFVTFVMMVYYLRKQYAVAAFAITLNLVLLFHVEDAFHPMLMVTRFMCTLAGAALAVISGFALLPTWDRTWLPLHFAQAIDCNYKYFINTFYKSNNTVNWTQNKRSSESKNSNVFDSFNRFISEPRGKKDADVYYDLITYNIRITRDLTNIHVEQDERGDKPVNADPKQQAKLNDCLYWFNMVLTQARQLNPSLEGPQVTYDANFVSPVVLDDLQLFYVEKLLIELKSMAQDMEKLEGKEHIE